MATIMFAMAPILSHYNASFQIAQYYKEKGHRIIYIDSNRFFRETIESRGYTYVDISGDIAHQAAPPGEMPYAKFVHRVMPWAAKVRERVSRLPSQPPPRLLLRRRTDAHVSRRQ